MTAPAAHTCRIDSLATAHRRRRPSDTLTPTQQSIFNLLDDARGELVSFDVITTTALGYAEPGKGAVVVVRTHISKLRRVTGRDIINVIHHGYRMPTLNGPDADLRRFARIGVAHVG